VALYLKRGRAREEGGGARSQRADGERHSNQAKGAVMQTAMLFRPVGEAPET